MALVKGDGGEGGEQRKKEEEDMVLQKVHTNVHSAEILHVQNNNN